MQEILPQLSVLVVLTGVSVAVVQYLFINHQTRLKDFIVSLKKIDFDKDNEYDSGLEKRWDDAINDCKKHIYWLNPNASISIGFAIIVVLILVYCLASFFAIIDVSIFFLNLFLLIISVFLFLWAIVNTIVLRQVFNKESDIRTEFNEIATKHQLVDEILSNKE